MVGESLFEVSTMTVEQESLELVKKLELSMLNSEVDSSWQIKIIAIL